MSKTLATAAHLRARITLSALDADGFVAELSAQVACYPAERTARERLQSIGRELQLRGQLPPNEDSVQRFIISLLAVA